MSGDKTKYSQDELTEFEAIIIQKLDRAKKEYGTLVSAISRRDDTGTDMTTGALRSLEDGTETEEKERLNQLASRQEKFIRNLEDALVRIKNGTYGVCIDTGKLIAKERLKSVPHTLHSIESKLKQKT